jgi:RNA polymerase sigma-70 factor (ECF subfamily)
VHAADPAARDAELVQLSRGGSREAFGLLVTYYSRTVRAVCLARTGHRDIDDLVQETFLRAYKGLGRLENGGRFGAYLLRIASNLCIDRLRRQRRDQVSLDEVELEPPPASSHDEKDERIALVRRGIGRLPEAMREALLLFYFEDLSYAQMAALLGITEAAVNQRLSRARAQLRAWLGAGTERRP